MSVDLLIVHVLFVVACVYFSHRRGVIHGSETTVEVFLEKKLVTEEQLAREFGTD
jgi:hypothetical protein